MAGQRMAHWATSLVKNPRPSRWGRARRWAPGLIPLFFAAGPAMAGEPAIRVGLTEGVAKALVATSVPGVIEDGAGRAIARTRAMEGWQAKRSGRYVALHGPTGWVSAASPVRFVPEPGSRQVGLAFGAGRWYRGEIDLVAVGSRLTIVNQVPLEQYLYGVVPAEMNPGWPLESLKAQAVAARTYALAKLGQFASRGYDLRPNTENQVYRGAGVETVPSNSAVDQTHGLVLTYRGHVIPAYFHSCSGGYTEASAAVWGEPHPYLQAVPDYDQQSPRYVWQKNVAAEAMRLGLSRVGIHVGEVLRFDIVERSYSGRVQRIRVVGSDGARDASGDQVRQAAGLYSTLFNVLGYGGMGRSPRGFAFAGRGHGHGLGLSQWGARGLSERGYDYAQILAHYYPGTQLAGVEEP